MRIVQNVSGRKRLVEKRRKERWKSPEGLTEQLRKGTYRAKLSSKEY